MLLHIWLTNVDLPTHVSAQIRYILPPYIPQSVSSRSFRPRLIIFDGSVANSSAFAFSNFSLLEMWVKFFCTLSFASSFFIITSYLLFNSFSGLMWKVSSNRLYASLLFVPCISETQVTIFPLYGSWLVVARYLLSQFLPINHHVNLPSKVTRSVLSKSQFLPTLQYALITTSLKSSLSISLNWYVLSNIVVS